MDEDNCMVDIARFFLDFTVDESCGKCTPCRIGTRRMLEILQRITNGQGQDGDIERLENLAYNIRTPRCAAWARPPPTRVLSTLRSSVMSTRRIYMRSAVRQATARRCSITRSIPKSAAAARLHPRLPGRRYLRHPALCAHYRCQQVPQVRRLHGEVQGSTPYPASDSGPRSSGGD